MSGTCKPDWAMIMSFAPKNGKGKKKTAICKSCGKEKPEAAFYRRSNGYLEAYACKVCKRKAAKQYLRWGGKRQNARACVSAVED